jgi:RNA polymerase sigma-70 factor (ECF subfamily)
LDEQQLVGRILKGDERAKAEFYRAYQQKLYSFCVYFLGNNDPEIEDILQEVFLGAFQKLPEFEFRSSLDTWLTQICIHQCYRFFRRRGKLVAQEEEILEAQLQPKALEAADQAAKDRERNQRLEIIGSALGKMGENCRKILELRKEGVSYIEMARMLKIPIGTVMSRLARCTSELKEMVGRILQEGQK